MADIRETILDKYKIDIAEENVLKLYKVEKSDISEQEIKILIENTRKRWNQSVNGANEKNAERDRARLEKADRYEAILLDPKIRSAVADFYEKGKSTGGSGGGRAGESESVSFAREYFTLVGTTKKLRKRDVDFFFVYYQAQRKNKKAILEMLGKEFKIRGLGKGEAEDSEEEPEKEGKKKNELSPVIVNLFQEATVVKLKKALDFYDTSLQSAEVCKKYPEMRDGVFQFLQLDKITTMQQFVEFISEKGKEAYNVRQEKGTEFVPLVDFFNTLQELTQYQDVTDNPEEFKLLIKYPKLTPYMYAFVDMKPATLNGIVDIANRDYAFRDNTDFILNYYDPVHDNFGISDSSISSIIQNAKKKAKQNKILGAIDEKLGVKKRKMSVGAQIIHWMAYCPIFLLYVVFEIVKVIFTQLRRLAIPVFAAAFIGENFLYSKLFHIKNVFMLVTFFKRENVSAVQNYFTSDPTVHGISSYFLVSGVVLLLLSAYVLPALFAAIFAATLGDNLNKSYDWIGLERTFQKLMGDLRIRSEDLYLKEKRRFMRLSIRKIILNLVCTGILVFMIILAAFRLKLM